MRTILVIALLSGFVVAGKAQAPALSPSACGADFRVEVHTARSDGGARIKNVTFRFANGIEIQANDAFLANPNEAGRRVVEVRQGAVASPTPEMREFILRGDVRLKVKSASAK